MIFMLAPLVIVCLVAFTPANTLSIPLTSFSLRWFTEVFRHADFMQSFWNSLVLAFMAATISVGLAVPVGLALTRFEFRGRAFLNGLFLSPLIVPHLVLGVAMLQLFSLIGATIRLIDSGVFDRHPKLTVHMAHLGGGISSMLGRIRAWNQAYRTWGRLDLGFGLYLLRAQR